MKPTAPFRPASRGTKRLDNKRPDAKPSAPRTQAPMRVPDHPGLAARLVAQTAVISVVENHLPLSDWFEGPAAETLIFSMEARDIALARSIALTTLRHLGSLRQAVARFLERGIPRKSGPLEIVLLISAAQILYMDVPDHAAVDLAVRLARMDRNAGGFAGLANGVLRNIIRARAELLHTDPLKFDTPQWLAQSWIQTYGLATAQKIAQANATEPTLDLTVKSDAAGWAKRLGGHILPTGSVRLEQHQPIAELEGYAAGEFWVQDSAASLPARLLATMPGERVADLCAAPGGKTAQLALTGADVTAFDRSAHRLKRVSENLARLKLPAKIVVVDLVEAKVEAPLFDAVLLDAPCTATGTIRRHPDVARVKQPEDVIALADIQRQMLDKAFDMLKPGGRLVYCVCSLQEEEGPAQIRDFLARNPGMQRLPISVNEVGLAEIITPDGDLRTLPHHLSGQTARLSGLDGFYAARLQRKN